MTTIGKRLATTRLRTACVVVVAAFSASCSVTSDDSLKVGSTGFGSALASVLSQAEAQLSADEPDDQLATGFAGVESGQPAATARVGDADLPAAVGFVPAGNPASQAAAAPLPKPAAAPAPEATTFLENGPGPAPAPPAEKRSFLSSLFASKPAEAAAPRPMIGLDDKRPAEPSDAPAKPSKPLVKLASTGGKAGDSRPVFSGDALPGVRQGSLFEITRKSGLDDDSDIDLHEGEPLMQVASAAGLARLAPNGLLKQTEGVDVGCLKPSLVRMLKGVEQHFGKKMIVTSGYRNPERNRKARGARNSLHMYCAAADVQVPGVDKWQLAKFVRSMPGRGGVGTYCHTNSVHIDVGPERDWNWRCRSRKG
ncbi:YcbK family protein [Aquibium sp. ELW1220]|uniref:YcbK family protein n=1 Tax=Aquibium sp. ELW1220 TaxID=2976766 RepID=UPI0025B238ED|nr:YcbK family protein [Aquibium sp. ELW1220]MDN2579182.1 YcbK family protein [Aquibium sp. ELW1220]